MYVVELGVDDDGVGVPLLDARARDQMQALACAVLEARNGVGVDELAVAEGRLEGGPGLGFGIKSSAFRVGGLGFRVQG